jgi:hypothetical protein
MKEKRKLMDIMMIYRKIHLRNIKGGEKKNITVSHFNKKSYYD